MKLRTSDERARGLVSSRLPRVHRSTGCDICGTLRRRPHVVDEKSAADIIGILYYYRDYCYNTIITIYVILYQLHCTFVAGLSSTPCNSDRRVIPLLMSVFHPVRMLYESSAHRTTADDVNYIASTDPLVFHHIGSAVEKVMAPDETLTRPHLTGFPHCPPTSPLKPPPSPEKPDRYTLHGADERALTLAYTYIL